MVSFRYNWRCKHKIELDETSGLWPMLCCTGSDEIVTEIEAACCFCIGDANRLLLQILYSFFVLFHFYTKICARFLANVNSCSRSLYVVVCLSVVCL